MKKNYTLCEGTGCPLKESCARYLPDLVRRNTVHWDPIPYNEYKKSCFYYTPDPPDDEEIFNTVNN
jgi:hypothetical protein